MLGQRAETRPSAEARGQWAELRRSAEALLRQAGTTRQAGLMSPSVQAEVLRKMVVVAPEEQKLIERAVRIGHKTRQPAALRNWYKIQPWHYP